MRKCRYFFLGAPASPPALGAVDDELRLTTRRQELRRAQAIVARYGKDDASWSEELLAERRAEAARE